MLDTQQNKGGDKKTLIAMVLIGLIFAWTMTNMPEEKPKEDSPNTEQSTEQDKHEVQKEELPVVPSFSTVGDSSAPVVAQTNETILIENNKLTLEFETLGGQVKSAILKEYQTYDKQPLDLMDGEKSDFDLVFAKQGKKVHTNRLMFDYDLVTEGDNQKLTFTHKDELGGELHFIYTLNEDDYHVGFDVKSINMEDQLGLDPKLKLAMQIMVPRHEKNIENERNLTTVFYRDSEEVDYLSETSEDQETIQSVKWVAFKDQFFSTILRSDQSFPEMEMKTVLQNEKNETDVKALYAETTIKLKDEIDLDLHLYFVPNHFKTLKTYGEDFQYLIPLGWGIFGWINRFVVIEMFHFLEGFNLGYGLIILIMALVIKIALFPLTKKSYTSMAAMRVLKPELDKIKEKHSDPAEQQQAQMKLYSQAGVSPLSGCLPMLLQMPILFALFRFFPASIELRQESFLWADDLSTFDNVMDLGFHIPLYGAHISLFALLMALSSFLQMIFNNNNNAASSGNPMADQMKYMMYFMPVIFLGVMNSYAAALSYYYFIANMMTFAQQLWIRKTTNDEKILAKIEANKSKPKKGAMNRFQRRMEEMMKEQEKAKK
ncbi:MAG: membrane protein insertase YidC [Flavobacteriales bacterium]